MSGNSRTVLLEFPPEQVEKPLVSRAVRGFGVEINILQARISPSEVGRMLAVVEGAEEEVEGTLEFFRKGGVKVAPAGECLVLDGDLCTHCGACSGQCPTGAFATGGLDARVTLDVEKCIACGICIRVCAYGAVRPGDILEWAEVAR